MENNLGLGLRPGDAHYRAFIGPPEDYDLISAMTFGLLTVLGLRQHHRLLDIGCGSLRSGRLFIPYLNAGNYVGIEPNEWLVKDGIHHEVGESLIQIKKPTFVYADNANSIEKCAFIDFAVAQSVFSHAGADIIEEWLSSMRRLLKSTGTLVATFCLGDSDFDGNGWLYPGCVNYTASRMHDFAIRSGLQFQLLDWKHPRQQWALFSMPDHRTPWIVNGSLSWNSYMTFLREASV